ncbi:globin domain-containing protein [Streptomyces cocklensis]|jgi:hemoglobin-like flavoprotein|uniref:Flavohemoprotein (Hemoglobin-like protein) (Flavohemoglobin) (Nitric oxide dioxygenase) n=1 Tax=Actinacidiphila cocklensis TaxID=887465 RepID=A0A9W4DPR8_9ACTN|nr:globin family protein [Actinacidiphila cocklensis]MDD1060604.1 globin domain-containing protein [Actinacidiphila cocklensis]WSX73870.1 globin domain-containing protein [Streptomyces sp. NBC_00899]WSX80065.1 globin domain-containing protein [Streptomyces sp. NBC_00899]CAG6394016.1 Flavohemoprotein (Hemoglobin-like protein) (Flavohemoglobin) (Nitric oxide dioxygenase) [Actinacidiphila cocklensis]
MTADLSLIRSSFAAVQPHGTQVTEYFYDHLFANNPQVRPLFAAHLDEQRDRLWAALGALVANLENTETLIGMLQNLGRRHVGYGAVAEHYPAVGASLIATLQHFAGDAWTPAVEESWTAVYGVISSTMVEAGESVSS